MNINERRKKANYYIELIYRSFAWNWCALEHQPRRFMMVFRKKHMDQSWIILLFRFDSFAIYHEFDIRISFMHDSQYVCTFVHFLHTFISKKKKKGTKVIIKLDISLFKSFGLIDLDKKEGRILSSGNGKPQKLDKKKKQKTNKKFSIKFPTNYSIHNVSCTVI